MAVTLTQAELSAAIRLGDSAEEVAEATRLLAFTTEAISRHLGDAYEGAPEAIVNEAAIRLAGYLFDQPNAGRGLAFANAGRNSGAWTMLLPYRVHRAGTTGEAVAAAQEAVGSPGNPVTGVTLSADTLTVTFADGTSESTPFTPGAGDGTDQTARDAAAQAQTRADDAASAAANAQADIDAHEAGPHNTDAGARTAAAAAATAATAQTTASTARDAATAAQADADTAQTTAGQAQATATAASTAANAAQADIDDHEANHPTGMGGGPPVLYEAATAVIGTSTGLITGNVICPETGELEFYFEGLTGTRQGGVAYARIPAARIRGAVSALNVAYNNDNVNVLVIPHGANHGIGVAVQATTNYLMPNAQAPGNHYIRIAHIV